MSDRDCPPNPIPSFNTSYLIISFSFLFTHRTRSSTSPAAEEATTLQRMKRVQGVGRVSMGCTRRDRLSVLHRRGVHPKATVCFFSHRVYFLFSPELEVDAVSLRSAMPPGGAASTTRTPFRHHHEHNNSGLHRTQQLKSYLPRYIP